jgi:hypothetical protein
VLRVGSPLDAWQSGRSARRSQHRFQRLQIGVRAQQEDDAVETLVLLDLGLIDFEVVLADRFEVATIAGIADECFATPRELAL